MSAIVLPKNLQKILVVGPSYNQLNKIDKLIDKYDYIILNSGMFHPSMTKEQTEIYFNILKELLLSSKIVYINGRYDYLLSNNTNNINIKNMILNGYNLAILEFVNRNVLIMDGGIPINIKTKNELLDNIEISFTTNINNKTWHQSYNGKFGYIISNNPITSSFPRFYNYSMQLGSEYGKTVYAQEVEEIGLKQTIIL